jgi:hypothetical protein
MHFTNDNLRKERLYLVHSLEGKMGTLEVNKAIEINHNQHFLASFPSITICLACGLYDQLMKQALTNII